MRAVLEIACTCACAHTCAIYKACSKLHATLDTYYYYYYYFYYLLLVVAIVVVGLFTFSWPLFVSGNERKHGMFMLRIFAG